MPCGGIYSKANSPIPFASFPAFTDCWQCGKGFDSKDFKNPPLFVMEWDCFIHYLCLAEFLETEEGEIITKYHQHEIIITFADEQMQNNNKCKSRSFYGSKCIKQIHSKKYAGCNYGRKYKQ